MATVRRCEPAEVIAVERVWVWVRKQVSLPADVCSVLKKKKKLKDLHVVKLVPAGGGCRERAWTVERLVWTGENTGFLGLDSRGVRSHLSIQLYLECCYGCVCCRYTRSSDACW